MELTRRDAVAALAAVGATGGAAVGVRRVRDREDSEDGTADDASTGGPSDRGVDEGTVRATMTAVAEVVYPEAVDGTGEFVDRFLDGRLDGSAHARGLREAVGELDDVSRA